MKSFVALVVIVLALGTGIYIGSGTGFLNTDFFRVNFFNRNTNTNITSTVKEILPVSEYTSLVYHYSDVITHSDALRLFSLGNIPFTERRAIYTIDGAVRLGFSGRDIRVESSYNTIILYMPAIKILSHEIFPETFNLYDERTGLFNRYSLRDANEIQISHKTEREKKVMENTGLYEQARLSAEQAFTSLLESMPGVRNNYRIIYRWTY